MKVSKLIEILQEADPNKSVYLYGEMLEEVEDNGS